MTTRSLLVAALFIPFACVDTDDPENRDAELVGGELAASESADELEGVPQRTVDDADDPSCDADLTQVDPGEYNAYFHVVSPQEIELDPAIDFTIDPDGTTLFADNGRGGIEMTCRCADACSGGQSACLVSADAETASCTGSCSKDGAACGTCGWHYGDLPAPRDPAVPRAPKPALPDDGENALP